MKLSHALARAAVLVLLVAVQIACERRGGETRTFRSVDGRYVVEASGRFDSPSVMFIEHAVRVRVFHDGATLLEGRKVLDADILDRSFDTKFAPPTWVSPSILRFPSAVKEPESDVIVIRNLSSKTLKYVEIVASDLLLLFDVAAGAVPQVPVSSQERNGTTFVRASFVREGHGMVSDQVDFFPREHGVSSVTVQIDLSDEGVAFRILTKPPQSGRFDAAGGATPEAAPPAA